MTTQDKKDLVKAALAYMQEKDLSQNKFSRIAGVNPSYMSNILNGVFSYTHSKTGEERDIDDKWFLAIANAIGYSLKKEYWPLVQTEQFVDVVKELTEARESATTRTLIGETGSGKTYSVDRFIKAYPQGTFKITCNKNDTIHDLVRKIQAALNTKYEGSVSRRIDCISMELSRMADNGLSPVLIFDECEYLSLTGVLSIKTFYDYLNKICSISLTGSPEFIDKLEKWMRTGKEGVRQFYRRIKAGIRFLRPVDRTFSRFFEGKGVDRELREILIRNADNYGELADYLEPAIREADRQGVPLSLEFFQSMFYLSKK